MSRISDNEIINYLHNKVEPIENQSYGRGYRASVSLIDGTFLPCVIFRNPEEIVNLAIKRFDQEKNENVKSRKSKKNAYREIVKHFITSGNRLNSYDIGSISISKNAIPLHILNQIHGETTMGWTGFVLRMNDKKCFGFGTSFLFEFFDLPNNYTTGDIKEVINHSYVNKNGEIKSHKDPSQKGEYDMSLIYREKPYFECYIESL